jgi:hypothetical protein
MQRPYLCTYQLPLPPCETRYIKFSHYQFQSSIRVSHVRNLLCYSSYCRGIPLPSLSPLEPTNQYVQLKDHIIKLCNDYSNLDNETFIVFIDSLSTLYPEASSLGNNTSSTSAPFANKTPYECSLLLKQMCEEDDENCFDGEIFAILDEQSLKDDTLLLVEEPAEEDGGEAHSVRAVYEMAESQMLLWVAGKTTISEAKERVQEETTDGILRPGMDL